MQSIENSPDILAAKIEDVIFSNNKRDTGSMKYKNQVRSRVFNLKDKKNPALRVNVLMGLIQPEKIAVMTADEMASDEVKCDLSLGVEEGGGCLVGVMANSSHYYSNVSLVSIMTSFFNHGEKDGV